MRYRILIFLVIFVIASACGTDSPTMNAPANATPAIAITPQLSNSSTDSNSSVDSETKKAEKNGHEHTAPNGGTLIVFGKEFAHLEIVVEPASGQVNAYALDGEAERSVKIAQGTIVIEVEKPTKFSITLDAVEDSLTGEKLGATSEFRGQAEQLKELNQFDGRVKSITIRGRKFDNVKFSFPKGNEGVHSD